MSKGDLKRQAAVGLALLAARRIVIQAVFSLSNIFLARLLFPADFGVWAIIISFGAILTVFSDLGLGPSLIQKRESIKKVDIQTVFTFQFFLALILFSLVFLIAPIFASFYKLGESGVLLLRIFSVTFLISPFKVLPVFILERELAYKKLVFVEIISQITGSLITVALAFWGFGVFSFAWGLVAGILMNSILLLFVAKWPIGFRFNKESFLSLSRFGLPYQVTTILGLFYGPLVLLYLGKQVGEENLGFFQFAASLSVFPMAFAEIVNKIAFPLGSRVEEKEFFAKVIEKSISLVSLTTLPIVVFMLVSASDLIQVIYTDRWARSLPALYLGLFQMAIVAYTGIFSQLLLSMGKAKIIMRVSFLWVVLTWILAPFLIGVFNFVGLSMTNLIVSFLGIFYIFKLKDEVTFGFWKNFMPYLLSSLISGLLIFILLKVLVPSFLTLAFAVFAGALVYLFLVLVIGRKKILDEIKIVASIIQSN